MKQNEKSVKKLLVESAAEQLLQYIVSNDLKPNCKLPNELELAKQLSIGRSTVREAIRSLAGRNILDVRHGAGTFVVEDRLGIADDPLGFIFVKDKKRLLKDLLEVRLMIEPRIASLAAASASDADIADIKRLCNEMDVLIDEGKDFSLKDVEFHVKIAMSSGNCVVSKLLPILQQSVQLFAYTSANNLTKVTMETHHDIATAIAARDCVAASDAMTLHIIHNRSYFFKSYLNTP
jgi:GntR family transcriptional repressor for pyruvate dehydrogenase complex